ncbi:MAG: hypothetical protein ACXWNC_09625, partial [Anaerolineales bacterium]
MSNLKDFVNSSQNWLKPKLNQAAAMTRKKNFWPIAIPVLIILIAIGSYGYYQSVQAKKKSAAAAQSP